MDDLAAKYYDMIAIISQGINAKTNFTYTTEQVQYIMSIFDFSGEEWSIKSES